MSGLTSCHFHAAKEVIALADSIDQTEHVVYDDTVALDKAIRSLNNPIGRMLMPNTLGKAYYYMGRNYSLSNQIAEAAECYIEADRLQIDDPIYRGRVNSCMGYICSQNNNDSLALIFYERASEDFKESGNEWYYAQMLLDCSERHINLHKYCVADSLLQIAQSDQLDNAYSARFYETRGLYFYEQQQYDSALVYFQEGLDYWQSKKDKCFSWLKMMQIYFHTNQMDNALFYSNLLISTSNNPNYLSNAYYCLLLDAQKQNDAERMSEYTHARSDAQKLLRNHTNQYATATPQLENYLQNPHPWR
jgi:tetratricopeptide (TPR) repeat protein